MGSAGRVPGSVETVTPVSVLAPCTPRAFPGLPARETPHLWHLRALVAWPVGPPGQGQEGQAELSPRPGSRDLPPALRALAREWRKPQPLARLRVRSGWPIRSVLSRLLISSPSGSLGCLLRLATIASGASRVWLSAHAATVGAAGVMRAFRHVARAVLPVPGGGGAYLSPAKEAHLDSCWDGADRRATAGLQGQFGGSRGAQRRDRHAA